ncbi:hypothetical protein BJ912DRAFT_1068040 [Pholiota molesta]|nr:hypothetical protein BJ912DRAFT_1068040 [Pholiota molesta]
MCCLSPPGPGPVVVKYQRELPNALSHCGINGGQSSPVPPMLTHPDATPSPAATPSPDPAPAAPAATPEPARLRPAWSVSTGFGPTHPPGPAPLCPGWSPFAHGCPRGPASQLSPSRPLVPQVSTASEHGGLSQPDPILSPLTTHHSLFSDVEEDGPDTVGSPGFEPHPDLASSIPTGLVEPHPDLASSVPTSLSQKKRLKR